MFSKKLFNFVDYAAYINLNSRIDKRRSLELHFSELGILKYVNRLPAPEYPEVFRMIVPEMDVSNIDATKIVPEIKSHCCWVGHYKIIKEAKSLGAKNALVFEDDAVFFNSPHYSPVDLVTSALSQLKFIPDWKVLYLGSLPDPHSKQAMYDLVAPNIIRVYQTYGAHAVLYNSTVFDAIIQDCETYPKNKPFTSADEYLNKIFDDNKYLIYPMAVIQGKFNSDIVNGTRDWYDWEKSYEKIKNRLNIEF